MHLGIVLNFGPSWVAMVALRPFRRAESRRNRGARRAFWHAVPPALRFAGRRTPRSARRATNQRTGGNGRAATIPPSGVEAESRGKTRVLARGSAGPALRWPAGAPQRGARHQPENRWQWSRCDHSAERSRGGIAGQDARSGTRFRRPCASLAGGRLAARGVPPRTVSRCALADTQIFVSPPP